MELLFFLFGVIVLIHGLLHLLGFANGYELAHVPKLSRPISKPVALLWLFTTLVFGVAFVFLVINHDLWWVPAFAGVILSQALIISYWKDAKAGTIINVLIIIVWIISNSI